MKKISFFLISSVFNITSFAEIYDLPDKQPLEYHQKNIVTMETEIVVVETITITEYKNNAEDIVVETIEVLE